MKYDGCFGSFSRCMHSYTNHSYTAVLVVILMSRFVISVLA
jgi:hypothetical protein